MQQLHLDCLSYVSCLFQIRRRVRRRHIPDLKFGEYRLEPYLPLSLPLVNNYEGYRKVPHPGVFMRDTRKCPTPVYL